MDDLNGPATKGDLELLRGDVQRQFDQLRAEMSHQYDDLKETLRDGQTEILKAFYGYTQTTDAKLKESDQADYALRQRLTVVESRLLEVEKRLNMPPAA
jgi:hypothetical protein